MQNSTLPKSETGGQVLVCTSGHGVWQRVQAELADHGLEFHEVTDVESAIRAISERTVDVCLLDDGTRDEALAAAAAILQNSLQTTQFLCLTSTVPDQPSDEVPPIRCQYVPEQYSTARLTAVVSAAVERSRLLGENLRLKRQISNRNLTDMVGTSSPLKALRDQVQEIANRNTAVLVQGEPGSGTKLVARAIHTSSRRAHRPFVKLDCSVLSTATLERELFAGRPPGEDDDSTGCRRLERAAGGTLSLDNIESISLPLQKKLAAELEQQSHEDTPVRLLRRLDIRLICTTHTNLGERVRQKSFNKDLFHCLNGDCLTTPALRQRREDIAPLSEHYLIRMAVTDGTPPRRLTLEALELLEKHHWSTNMRELQSVLQQACSLDVEPRLTADMIRPWLSQESGEQPNEAADGLTLKEMERKLIETTFARCEGNRERTAQMLSIGLRTLSGKLRDYGYPPRGGPGSNVEAARLRAA